MITTSTGITIEVYSSGTTRITDPDNELAWAEGLTFATAYPGGDMDASFTIKRDIVAWWALKGAQRVVFRQGQRILYEGYIAALDRLLDEQDQAIRVPLVGGWSHIMMSRRWQKWWCDTRIDESVWKWINKQPTFALGADKCGIDRNNRLRFIPKAEIWNTNDGALLHYSSPTGETVKQITFDYDLQEGTQAWTLAFGAALSDGSGDGAALWSATASGTGNQDITLGTAKQYIRFYLLANATQTPTSDGTYYGQVSNIKVRSQVGTITPYTVGTAVIAHFTELNSSIDYMQSNTNNIEPFMSDWATAAEILTDAVGYGDASNNHWAGHLLNSEYATTPDGKPLVAIEQYPVLTDYDLALRLDEINIAGPIEINQDFEAIANWIIVQYYDENGWSHWITPDDDATLKDTTSIADYGQRDSILTLGYSTSTVATNNGKRILATYKDPQWNSSPISVWDYIRRKNSDPILPSRIRAGQRLKIENFMRDLSGTGLTIFVTGTRYEDESGICTMTFGQPLSPLLTILTPPPRIIEDVISNQINQPAITAGEFVPGIEERETLNFYKDIEWKYALKKGWVTQAQFKKLTAKEKRALRKRVRRARG